MREICFKGRRVDNGKWVEGDLVHDAVNAFSEVIAVGIQEKRCYPVEVDPETACQFTGLYDSTKWQDLNESEREQWTRSGNMPSEWKGKRIFDGDIYHQGDTKITYTVVWKNLSYIGKQNGSNSYAGLEFWRDRIVIIGNIHDKKEGV